MLRCWGSMDRGAPVTLFSTLWYLWIPLTLSGPPKQPRSGFIQALQHAKGTFTTSSWDLPSVTTTAIRFLTWLSLCEEEKTWSTENLMALPVCKTDRKQWWPGGVNGERHDAMRGHVCELLTSFQPMETISSRKSECSNHWPLNHKLILQIHTHILTTPSHQSENWIIWTH